MQIKIKIQQTRWAGPLRTWVLIYKKCVKKKKNYSIYYETS